MTRSRSGAAGSVTSPESEMAPTVRQEEALPSPSTASKRLRISSGARRGRRGITGKVTAFGGATSTAGLEEVEEEGSVAPAASDSMEATAFVPNSPIPLLSKLPTLDNNTLLESKPIQESAADTILKASKFILGLSAYTGGVLLRQSSGILMEWNKGKGTILTTAHLFCSRSPNLDKWLGGQEYARDAQVRVQLLQMDDIEAPGELIYLDEQYGFALISVPMVPPETVPCFCKELVFSEDIILLGRDKWDLQIGNGKVMNNGARSYQRHHYIYFDDAEISECAFGGAVIDLQGNFIGLIATFVDFIPSSTILRCLDLWRSFDCTPRIHLGMKLFGIKCLTLVSREKISRKYNIDDGLIVKEVSGGSNAESHGVRMGDIILTVNEKCIATAIEVWVH
nr:unnamed protein product [Digitaria exilis]